MKGVLQSLVQPLGSAIFGLFVLALAGALALRRRMKLRHWRASADRLALHYARTPDGPSLQGVYRGRVLCATDSRPLVEIDVRVANRGMVIDHLRAGEPLPDAPWLSPIAVAELYALSPGALRDPQWQVEVAGQHLRLHCQPDLVDRPARLRFLMDLACDLADGVDQQATLPYPKFST